MRKPSEIVNDYLAESFDNSYTNSMKHYKYTIIVESEDLMSSELIDEFLGEAFEPSGLNHKLRGIVTSIKREEVSQD